MVDQIETYENPELESTLQLGKSPKSMVVVSDAASIEVKLANRLDKQRKRGANFGRLRFLGVEPAEFSISFVILPSEEKNFWRKVKPLLREPGKNGTAPPLEAIHPQINRVDVTTVTIQSVNIGQPSSATGREVQINVIEWTPSPTKTKDKSSDRQKARPVRLDRGFSGGMRGTENVEYNPQKPNPVNSSEGPTVFSSEEVFTSEEAP